MSGQSEAERLNTLALDVLEYEDCTPEGGVELAKGVVALQAQVEQGEKWNEAQQAVIKSLQAQVERLKRLRDADGTIHPAPPAGGAEQSAR